MWVYQNVAVSTVNAITLSNWFSAVTEDLHSARHVRVAAAHARGVSASYYEILDYDLGVILFVDFRNEGTEVVDYSLVLFLERPGRTETIRVYDSAHGFNEMHRYSRGGSKLDGVVFSSGTLGEGLRTAMLDIKERYLAMIEGWER